jgi:hypothetical protein
MVGASPIPIRELGSPYRIPQAFHDLVRLKQVDTASASI